MRALPVLAAALCAVQAAPTRPNIIMFLTDDQDIEMGSLAYMPKVQQLLVGAGATFTRMYAHVPVCCPSRSSLISGQYMHNNGCRANTVGANCSSVYFQQHGERTSYVTHLQAAGYRTSYAGKYLNDYGDPSVGGVAHVPVGWDNWQGLVGNSVYYSYTLSNNGQPERHGKNYSADYLPDVVLNKTLAYLEANLGSAPVFAVLSTPSCHGPQTAAPQYQDAFPGAIAPRGPTYNATVKGTSWLQETHGAYTFTDSHAQFSDLVFRRRIQTLQTVDDMLESVVGLLEAKGQLDNTYIVYTADNGYHAGAFGLVYDKRNPFETDTHLPMLIRGPGIAPGTATAAPVAMTDLSATFLRMAGLPIPQEFDGASMLEYVQAAPPAPRLATFIEYVGEAADGGPPALCPLTHGNAAVYCNPTNNYTEPPYWYGRDVCLCQDSLNNTYSCLRVVSGADAVAERAQMLSPTGLPHAPPAALDYRYCEFSDRVGTKEFFNLTEDPYELVNKVDAMDAGLRAALAQRLAALRACKGSAACLPLLTDPIQ